MKKTVLHFLFLFLVLLTSNSFKAAAQKRYCNALFSFCISYPTDFSEQGEPIDGSGNTFISKDKKAIIETYGSHDVLDSPYNGLAGYYKWLVDSIYRNDGYFINNYSVKKKSWCVFSGEDKEGNIVYLKVIKKTEHAVNYLGKKNLVDVFLVLGITYPASQQAIYKDYIQFIATWQGASCPSCRVVEEP